jgi:serine/threonine protein kinase
VRGDDPERPDHEPEIIDSRAGETIDVPTASARGRIPAGAGSDGPSARYRLVEVLGEGGMAVVHLAHDDRLQRQVALKLLRPGMQRRADVRQRFADETVILAGLDHPGAVPVYDAGRLASGEEFYAMKRVRGQTLKDLLDGRSPQDLRSGPSLTHLVDVFERVCQTVAAAHDRNVIHRDLKPANVMVDDLGAVYVMDWGLAKRIERDTDGAATDSGHTRVGDVMGTPAYMAPEQASGRTVTADTQTDVFSLGVTLYEILTGANPFVGRNARESIEGVLHHLPDPPRTVNRHAPRELSAVCMKALEKDPFRRYRTARELADDIRRYRVHRPVSAVSPRLVDRIVNWSRRRPATASVLATITGVAALAALVIGAQASVENALVASGYQRIDAALDRAAELDARLMDLSSTLDATSGPEARRLLEHRSRALAAERDVERDLASSAAMAILGFTVFSPDERAQEIVRDQWLRDIDGLIADGHVYQAEAKVRAALRIHEQGGLLRFSETDVRQLEDRLRRIETDITSQTGEPAPVSGRPSP